MTCKIRQSKKRYCIGDFRHIVSIFKTINKAPAYGETDIREKRVFLREGVFCKIESYNPGRPSDSGVSQNLAEVTHRITIVYDNGYGDLFNNSNHYNILDDSGILYSIVAQPQDIDNDHLYIRILVSCKGDNTIPVNIY